MIIFLYGKDTYRARAKMREIEKRYRRIHAENLDLIRVNASEVSFQDFLDQALQTSIFVKKKLVFLEDVFLTTDFEKKFLKKIEEFAKLENIILVLFQAGEISKKNKLFLALEKYAECQEFQVLKGESLKKQLIKKARENGLEFSDVLLQRLIDSFGNDLWKLSNEIDKIAAFLRNKPQKRVRLEDIEYLCSVSPEVDIFKTIGYLGRKNKKIALELLEQHLKNGDNPFYLLSMVNYQFKNLLATKDFIMRGKSLSQLLALRGLPSFALKKYWLQAEKFSLKELKKICQQIFEADLDIKTGKAKPEEELRTLIAEI